MFVLVIGYAHVPCSKPKAPTPNSGSLTLMCKKVAEPSVCWSTWYLSATPSFPSYPYPIKLCFNVLPSLVTLHSWAANRKMACALRMWAAQYPPPTTHTHMHTHPHFQHLPEPESVSQINPTSFKMLGLRILWQWQEAHTVLARHDTTCSTDT